MTKQGLCTLGPEYIPKAERLRSLLGVRKHGDAVRAVIDAVLEDADEAGITELPRRAIGIKPFTARKKKKAPRSSAEPENN